MPGEWEDEARAWMEFEEAGLEEEKLWAIMDGLLGSGQAPGVAEKQILENHADAMDAAIEKTKATWARWKEEARKALIQDP